MSVEDEIQKRQEEYFQPVAEKSWKEKAIESTTGFTISIANLFERYKVKFSSYAGIVSESSLENTQKQFIRELEDVFQDEIISGVIPVVAEKTFANAGISYAFDRFNENTAKFLDSKKIKFADVVSMNTHNQVMQIIADGYRDGLMYEAIAKNIQEATSFSYARSEGIARTEIMSAMNYTDHITNQENTNVIGVEWVSTIDMRTRQTHVDANKQRVLKGTPFKVGGSKMLFPTDSSLGADVGEIVKCRCTTYAIMID